MVAAAKAKNYIVCSSDGCWHYAPVLTDDPESAVEISDSDWSLEDSRNTEYYVYELVSEKPIIIKAKVGLTRV